MKNKIVLSTMVLLAALGGLAAPRLAAAASGDKEPEGSALEEVVVTARRVKESMQNVPIAITAFSADSMREEHITSNQDLLGKVPSLIVSSNGQVRSSEVFTLRGQGAAFPGGPGRGGVHGRGAPHFRILTRASKAARARFSILITSRY